MHQMQRLINRTLNLNITGLLVVLLLVLSACGASRNISQGDKRFDQEQYERAITYYKKALESTGKPGEVNYKIAEAYRLSNRLGEAETYYKAALDANFRQENAYYYYGMALKANGKYEEANKQLRSYLGIGASPQLKALAAREVENYTTLQEILQSTSKLEVQNLEKLNTDASEFAPYILEDQLIFSSTRSGGKAYPGNGEGFIDIYATSLTDSLATIGSDVRKFESINLEGIHDALATFANDGRTMVFARSNEGTKKGRRNVDLFITTFRSDTWSEPKLLSVNDPEAWDSSPAFSPDGKTLYFSSDRKGGLGGNDIYKATIDANNKISAAENLGPGINTPGNESFVHVAPDGTLYIASDGLPGLGNLDIFKVENGKPVNMGAPINSNGDDFSIFIHSKNNGFFSSNREGGKGGDDLYGFMESAKKRVDFIVDGTVYLLRDGTRTRTIVPELVVILQNDRGQKIRETKTDAEGKFTFRLDSASAYSVVAEKDSFFTARQRITTIGKMPEKEDLKEDVTEVVIPATLVLNQIVKEKAIVLENIFYDFDKAAIRPDAAVELDKLVEVLNDNPDIAIELSSHTDLRGSDVYNLDLSQRRADAAVEYIISKGISKDRITAKGYGETKPVVPNATTDEEHQRNRRTEFKVIDVKE